MLVPFITNVHLPASLFVTYLEVNKSTKLLNMLLRNRKTQPQFFAMSKDSQENVTALLLDNVTLRVDFHKGSIKCSLRDNV